MSKIAIKKLIKSSILIGVILFIIYLFYVFSLWDLRLRCSLFKDEIFFKARQIYYETTLKAEKMLMEKKKKAYNDFLSTVEKEIPKIEKAKSKGMKEYLGAYLKYKRALRKAREKYKIKIKEAEKEALAIKREAKNKANNLIKQAKRNLNPLFLLVKAHFRKRKITGYKYYPHTGEIIPRIEIKKGK